MLPQRAILRSSQQALCSARQVTARSAGRRWYSASETTFTGAQDNAFNRERAAVKAHAAATSGMTTNFHDKVQLVGMLTD